nr:MAG TPA: hypothetical protein [Caudoviricetes sp.]
MLKITVPAMEYYDEVNNEFILFKEQSLQLEHSLVSISKWEAKWHKPFLDGKDKTLEEVIDYVRCMTITQNVNPEVYTRLTENNLKDINEYIENPMTATTFSDTNQTPNREIITSEIIYYWMVAFNIPFECQKWHINRLLTLVKVCNIKNAPAKKMGQNEILQRNRALNEARKKKLNTKG